MHSLRLPEPDAPVETLRVETQRCTNVPLRTHQLRAANQAFCSHLSA